MKANKRFSENGQASVLLAIAFIVLLAFTALAIDGGMVYSNRRHAQNASDASSLAGGSAAALYLENHYVIYGDWSCSDGRVIAAQNNDPAGAKAVAIARAGSNDYAIDTDVADKNGVSTECVDDADNGSWIDKYLDIKTLIPTDTKTAFAHFVYSGPLRNTVEAVTRVRPRTPLAFGNAIVALGLDCADGGIEFDGTSDVNVTGGGIFSNSCIDGRGAMDVNVVGEYDISCVLPDCYTQHGGSGSINPTPEEDTGIPIPPSAYAVPQPDCNGLPNYGNYNKDGTLEAGRYSQVKITNGDHTMEPGLYCVTGDFEINGGTLSGTSVTIYILTGNFHTSGNATTSITAPPARGCGSPCTAKRAVPGVLVYLAEGNTNEATLSGTPDTELLGLVYVPDGTIEAGGSSSQLAEIHAQLVGNDTKIHGTTSVVINFDDQLNYQLPAALELFK